MVKNPQKITSDDCVKWKENKLKNPLTGYEFKAKEKSKEYKRFVKECQGFKTPEKPEVLSVPIKDAFFGCREFDSFDHSGYCCPSHSRIRLSPAWFLAFRR